MGMPTTVSWFRGLLSICGACFEVRHLVVGWVFSMYRDVGPLNIADTCVVGVLS